jgi:hypothetical protein
MRDVTIAGDLIAGVNDDDPLFEVVSQHTRNYTKHRRLADARSAEQQNALTRFDEITDNADRPVDCSADPARQANDIAGAVADGGDAVQGPFDAGPIVVTETSDTERNLRQILACDFVLGQPLRANLEAGFRATAQIKDELDQTWVFPFGHDPSDGLGYSLRQDRQQIVEIVGDRDLSVHWHIVWLGH